MATFQVTISITKEDVAILKEQGYSLYGFKSVAASGSGQPTVWIKQPKDLILGTTVIKWTEDYAAYNSISVIENNVQIVTSNTEPADLGNLVTIIKDSGNLVVTADGIERSISFLNNNNQQYTVGISQQVDEKMSTLCAFPILGTGSTRTIMPISKIALIFSTDIVETSTVITRAMSSGALIDLTGVDKRVVTFSLNDGWSADSATWLTSFNAFESMSELLIVSPSPAEEELRRQLGV
jgi:hypothetical protein